MLPFFLELPDEAAYTAGAVAFREVDNAAIRIEQDTFIAAEYVFGAFTVASLTD